MKCKKCGALIPDDAVVCGRCGASVENEMSDFDDETRVINQEELRAAAAAGAGTEASEEIFDENEKKRQEQKQKMMEDKKKQLSEIERRRNEKRKRQRRKKAAIIALICALAVSGAGIGAYYIAQGINGDTTVKMAASPSPPASAASPSPSASPLASPSASPITSPGVSISPQPSASTASASSGSGSWTSTGNGGNSSSSSQRTASNTGSNTASQRTASNTASSSSSGSGTSGGSGGTGNAGASSAAGTASTAASSVTNSGLVSEPISSRQVTGGEVIYNEGTGRYLMTFIMDGKRYYANVSEGSTTDQIQNKSFTIDADATQESYGGNTVYEISSMTNSSGSYILENSSTKLLTESDIAGMSKYDLALARNEIFARHGRKFQTAEYSRYFSSKSWYKINPNYNYSDDNANLNATEKQNVQFILNAEKNK